METAAKKPEQMGGGEDTQERGEEGGAAEQEEKVHDTLERSTIFAMYCMYIHKRCCSLFQEDDVDQDNPGAEVGS